MRIDGHDADERGVSTVLAASLMGLVVLVGAVGLEIGMLIARQHQVDGAADLVALSSAAAVQRGGDGCVVASRVAAANDVHVAGCTLRGADVRITVRGEVHLPFGIDGRLTGRARAGPVAP